MKTFFLLAATLLAVSLSPYAVAQNAPTYQPPSGLTATPSATGAVPVAGSATSATPAGTPATSSAPASSPTKRAGATGTASVADQKVQRVITQIVDETPLQPANGTPTTVAAKLPGLKTQPKLADIGDKLDYVRIVGTSSTNPVNGAKHVGIQWTTITRTDTGQTLTIESPLSSSMKLKGDVLPARTKVTAKGDADELYTAIRSLFNDTAPAQTSNPSTGGSNKKNESSTPMAGGQSNTQGDVQAKPLTSQTSTKDSQSSDSQTTTTFDTTTAGCAIRVDIGQMQAIQQEAMTTTENGKTTRGQCEDGGTRYTIQKTGLDCEDVVGDTQAQGQTRLYYVGPDGKPVTVQDCKPDAELIYPFVDEPSTCSPFMDFNAGKVFDQVETVYRNAKNVRFVVAACHPTGDGYAMQTTTDGCDLRDDFDKHQTFQQTRQFYTKGGVQNFISSCADSTTTYPHQVEACSNIVDSNAMKVFQASRIYIMLPNTGKSYRSECAPTGTGTDLLSTTSGCDTLHYDYPSAEQSRGASRLYYMNGGSPTYVTDCQENTTVYKWTFVRTGWQNDDAKLTSSELLAAHITLPSGDTVVSPGAIRPESAIVPYVSKGTQDIPNGDPKTYLGCNAYTPTTKSETYQRADATLYTIAIGAGTPQGPVDECTRTTETRLVFGRACIGASPNCASPQNYWVNNAQYVFGNYGYNTNPAGKCPQAKLTVGSGMNWNANQTRTATTYPAGAGGGTTYSAWTTTSYVAAAGFPIYEIDNSLCNGK